MNEEIRQKINKIADTYGYDAQSRQCIEEMAELTQAINKFWRKQLKCGIFTMEEVVKLNTDFNTLEEIKTEKNYQNLVEEIADVQIMLWQMEYLLKIGIEPIIEQKLDRQIERIKQKQTEAQNANP